MAAKNKSRKERINYAESDDEEYATAKCTDTDWSANQIEREQIQTSPSDTSLPEEIEFDSTEGFNLKTIKSVKQSHHVIWSRFGNLMKNGKIVERVKERIYCITCFEKKQFKR